MEIKNPYGFIYITTNMINGKRYIGQKKFCNRWKTYLGSGTLLIKALKKYGKENFKRDIVAIAYSKEELDKLEIEFIKNYNANDRTNFYNITKGGDGCRGMYGELNPMYGKHHSEESKKKIGVSNKGNSSPMKGKHHSPETIAKLREKKLGRKGELCPMYGKHHSEESKKKMSLARTRINNIKAKQVICLNTLEIFKTAKEAGEKYLIDSSGILKNCKNKYAFISSKEYGRIVFKYYDDYLKMSKEEIEQCIIYGKYCCKEEDKIICLENNKIYYCARQINKELGIHANDILRCCKGERRTAGKLHWQYYNEYIKLSGGEEQ